MVNKQISFVPTLLSLQWVAQEIIQMNLTLIIFKIINFTNKICLIYLSIIVILNNLKNTLTILNTKTFKQIDNKKILL
jgi:hypothetical protein